MTNDGVTDDHYAMQRDLPMPDLILLDGTSQPGREQIGGKAASVARMRALGLPVPPAFVVPTEVCNAYFAAGGRLPAGIAAALHDAVRWLEAQSGRRFGGAAVPLLVSVRSGAAISMPGMMDTVLNLGINDAVEAALAADAGSPAFARDSHLRFIDMYTRIVLGAEPLAPQTDEAPTALRARIAATTAGVPTDPHQQLVRAVCAVFDSWNGRRARRYRQHQGIADTLGTAVTVQAMVFGNLDARSGTGVLFSRNPLTGERLPYGEYLPHAQGEDVVSGAHTPLPLAHLRETLPEVHAQLLAASALLEAEQRDMQDIEFTVERGRLYLLQCRGAKRSPAAAVRCAVELVDEGLIDEGEALARVHSEQLRILLRPRLARDPALDGAAPRLSGEAASPGVGVGRIVFDADEAERLAAEGVAVVLARTVTSPEDIHGMMAAVAVITEVGGSTSHAAVVSRQLGVPCVVGTGKGTIATLADCTVTVDGSAGRVWDGALTIAEHRAGDDPCLARLVAWAERHSPLHVHAEAGFDAGEALDLRASEETWDASRLRASGCRGAVGGPLNSDEGVAAAVAAGLEFIAVRQTLPALLAACAAARTSHSTAHAR